MLPVNVCVPEVGVLTRCVIVLPLSVFVPEVGIFKLC